MMATPIRKSTPIGKQAALEQLIATATNMNCLDLVQNEIAELEQIKKANFIKAEHELDRQIIGLARMFLSDLI